MGRVLEEPGILQATEFAFHGFPAKQRNEGGMCARRGKVTGYRSVSEEILLKGL